MVTVSNNFKIIVLIILVIILLVYSIGGNSKFNRYIEKDKELFVNNLSNLIEISKFKIDSIISNDDKVYVEDIDIEMLKVYHRAIERSVFGFKLKSNLIDKDFGDEFQDIWDKYNYEKDINLDYINEYYGALLKDIKNKEELLLKAEDIKMLEEIYNFYIEMHLEVGEAL